MGSTIWAVNRKNGRVTENGGYVGDYDLAKGSLNALSSYNANGYIDAAGSIVVWHRAVSSSGFVEADGDLYLKGALAVRIGDKDARGGPLGWEEKRMIALVLAVYGQK